LTDEGRSGEALGINATTPPETDPNRPPESEAAGPDETAPPPPPPPYVGDEPPLSRPAAMTRSAFEDRSPRFLLGTIALAVVVALLAGFVIGYKVENSRGKPVKKVAATKKHKPKRTPGGAKFQLKAAPLLVGGTYGVTAKKLVVLNSKAKPVQIGIGPKTKVAVAEAAKASDIVVGSKVLIQPVGSSKTKAAEVVVLPATSHLGAAVTAVTPGTSMTIKDLSGKDIVITTTGATIEKTRSGTRRNIAKGDKLIVYYYVVRNRRNAAVQIVVLPSGTKFKQQTTTS
jgi:hypothetical protein